MTQQAPMGEPSSSAQAYVLGIEEGESLLLGARRAPVKIKVSPVTGSHRLSAVMEHIVPGDGVPVHLHEDADEVIFIHAGEGIEMLGEDEYAVSTGAVIYIPRGTWHGLRNATADKQLTVLAIFSPPGFEGFFRAYSTVPDQEWSEPTAEELAQIKRQYNYQVR